MMRVTSSCKCVESVLSIILSTNNRSDGQFVHLLRALEIDTPVLAEGDQTVALQLGHQRWNRIRLDAIAGKTRRHLQQFKELACAFYGQSDALFFRSRIQAPDALRV